MSDMVRIARKSRHEENFRGYIHLKTIPDAAPDLIAEAGLLADRLINVELPTDAAVKTYAPEKRPDQLRKAMPDVRLRSEASSDCSFSGKRPPRFAPAGQSTQVIVGADGSNDATVLGQSTPALFQLQAEACLLLGHFADLDSSAKLPLKRSALR